MKEKEVPDKIYMSPAGVLYKGDKQQDTDIEYICMDSFMKKAIKYIANHFLAPGMDNEIKDFKNYMKGE